MSKKISELESVTEANNNDILILNQNNETVQITKQNLFSNVNEKINNTIGTEEYDNSKTYSVGDYCIYENVLYVCTTAVTTAEDFDNTKWNETAVLEKNIITAGAATSVTGTESGEIQIPITQALAKVGDKFTVSNDRVYAGEGINTVLVSAQVYFNLAANRGAALNITIKKNGIPVNGLTNGGFSSTTTRNATLSIAPRLIPVQEGDYFEYFAYIYAGDIVRSDSTSNTFVTIEAIN